MNPYPTVCKAVALPIRAMTPNNRNLLFFSTQKKFFIKIAVWFPNRSDMTRTMPSTKLIYTPFIPIFNHSHYRSLNLDCIISNIAQVPMNTVALNLFLCIEFRLVMHLARVELALLNRKGVLSPSRLPIPP